MLDVLHTVPNVVILSGDRHEFAAIEFTGSAVNAGDGNAKGKEARPVYEFSTSPLSMFYVPFIRTLKMASERHVPRVTISEVVGENGTVEVEERVEMVPEERVLRYIATGNYKWCVISEALLKVQPEG